MISKKNFKIKLLYLLFILLIPVLAGCTVKTESLSSPEAELALHYRMPEDQSLKYQLSTEMTQKLEIPGRSMEIKASENSIFSLKPKGSEADNHLLEVTIDSMNLNIVTPQGNIAPDMSNVNGKSFDMTCAIK